MIGPLFVAAGVSAFDLIVGLLVGNLLAVLSWTLLHRADRHARAADALLPAGEDLRPQPGHPLQPGQRRDVLLPGRRDGDGLRHGRGRVVRIPHAAAERPLPEQRRLGGRGPRDGRAVLRGRRLRLPFVARVANIAAPWMVLVFVAFGIVGLRAARDRLARRTSGQRCNTVIWTGGAPLPGQVKFTFWHVMFFAWFCNMAMHIGMADLTVFRFARKSWYGVATSLRACTSATSSRGSPPRCSTRCSCTATRPTPPCCPGRWPTAPAAWPGSSA